MGASRALGALLCIACVVVAALHIAIGYFGLWGGVRAPWAFALPVTVGLLVVCGLGIWLGWIMASTKEAAPTPSAAESKTKEKKKKK